MRQTAQAEASAAQALDPHPMIASPAKLQTPFAPYQIGEDRSAGMKMIVQPAVPH
jgi:hypothetical protein